VAKSLYFAIVCLRTTAHPPLPWKIAAHPFSEYPGYTHLVCHYQLGAINRHSTVNCQPSTFTAFQPQITM